MRLFICAPSKAITDKQTPSKGWKHMRFMWLIHIKKHFIVSPIKNTQCQPTVCGLGTSCKQSLLRWVTSPMHPPEASLSNRPNRGDECIWGLLWVENTYQYYMSTQHILGIIRYSLHIKLRQSTKSLSRVRNSICEPSRAITDNRCWWMRWRHMGISWDWDIYFWI